MWEKHVTLFVECRSKTKQADTANCTANTLLSLGLLKKMSERCSRDARCNDHVGSMVLGKINTHETMIVFKLMININENMCFGVFQNDVGVLGRNWSR